MRAGLWTLPNALTGLRLLAVPVVGAVLVTAGDRPDGRVLALVVFVAAALTDAADGWLARRWGQCTPFGAFVDPIADKALVATALICQSQLGTVPWWATAVVLGREAAVTALRFTVLRYGVIPASRGGKVKTVAQTALIVLALAEPGWGEGVVVLAAGTALWTVVTGVDYFVKAAALTRSAGDPLAPAVALADGPQQGGGEGISRLAS